MREMNSPGESFPQLTRVMHDPTGPHPGLSQSEEEVVTELMLNSNSRPSYDNNRVKEIWMKMPA
jgi:hypothetical protein